MALKRAFFYIRMNKNFLILVELEYIASLKIFFKKILKKIGWREGFADLMRNVN